MRKGQAKKENSFSCQVRYPSAWVRLRDPHEKYQSRVCTQNWICMSEQSNSTLFIPWNFIMPLLCISHLDYQGHTMKRTESLSSKGLCSRAGHQSSAHQPSPACHLFRQIKFIITQPHSFVSALSTVAFVLQRQNSVFATETVWLASLKHSLSSPLHTKVCWLSIHL